MGHNRGGSCSLDYYVLPGQAFKETSFMAETEKLPDETAKGNPQGGSPAPSKSVVVKVDVLGSKGGSRWPR